MYRVKQVNKIGILSDIHFPFEDFNSLNTALKILKEEKPDVIILDGDILDCSEISKFDVVPNFTKHLRDEISLGWSFLSDLRKEHPNIPIRYIEGNHEMRIKTYLLKYAPNFYDELYLPDQLQFTKLGVEWIPVRSGATKFCDTYVDIEGVKIGHFDAVNQGAGMTVRNVMRKKGNGNYVQAHIHRGAIVYFTDINKNTYFGMETPCLCKYPYYSSVDDWQRGLSFIERNKDGIMRPRLIVF